MSDCDDLPIKLEPEEQARICQAPAISEFQRQKLDRDAKKNWDLFYRRNGDRFFKNRYWTRHEFSELFQESPSEDQSGDLNTRKLFLLEVGCGCGDFALPLLDAEQGPRMPKNSFIYCCDMSDCAIDILKSKPDYIRNHPDRIKAFVADITADAEQLSSHLDGNLMDMVSLVFVLSAIEPAKMKDAIMNLRSVMRPGGIILFRDYAIYDKAMLRFSCSSKICDQFYVRQDGTRAYFFRKNELASLFEECHFSYQSIDYVRRETVNNATKERLSRIFLQAKFRLEGP